jgi:hypothetical protein
MMNRPAGTQAQASQATRPVAGLGRRWGYTVLELMIYIAIVTALTLIAIRSVRSRTLPANSETVTVLLNGLDNLMLAHELSKPSCLGLVNSISKPIYLGAASWCWLFAANPAIGFFPIRGYPSEVYDPEHKFSALPTRRLSDFWDTNNGTDTAQSWFRTNTGVEIQVWYNGNVNNGNILMVIGLTREQILALGSTDCRALVSGLVERLVPQGMDVAISSLNRGSYSFSKDDVSTLTPGNTFNPYKEDPNPVSQYNLRIEVQKRYTDYCTNPGPRDTSISIGLDRSPTTP